MPKYRIEIRKKKYAFGYEEENLETFKDGLQNFISFVEEFGKPALTGIAKNSKRGGGRRPPFIKNAIKSIIEKEPEWLVNKFPEDIADKLRTEYGVVGAKKESTRVALVRLFKNHYLTRREIQGKYAYSVLTVPQ